MSARVDRPPQTADAVESVIAPGPMMKIPQESAVHCTLTAAANKRKGQEMRRYLIAFAVFVFVMATGTGTAFAGGSSDSSGNGFHCYLFFSLPDGEFAQAMVNDSLASEVTAKVDEFIDKYEVELGGVLDLATGNVAGTCEGAAPPPGQCVDDSQCAAVEKCCNEICVPSGGKCVIIKGS